MPQDPSGTTHINSSTRRHKSTTLDGQQLKRLTEAGFTWLKTNQQTVNALNVFPVPDGDTGTNMVLTMQAAWDEIANSPERNVGKMAHAIAHGALMGARGNSGVILSQLWRGFARALDHQEILDVFGLVRAFNTAKDTAYKGVVKPVEGTILTVAKDGAAACEQAAIHTNDLDETLALVVPALDTSVQNTPNLLPVLHDAGVVDSGGKGLFFILEGMLRYLQGLTLDSPVTTLRSLAAIELGHALESIEPGQDFEVVVDFRPNGNLDLEFFYTSLEKIGTSIQVAEGDGLYRVHIHVPTDKRYEPIDFTMSLGTITKVAMENLIAQMEDEKFNQSRGKLTLAPVEPGQVAVVAVAPGPGIARIFASLGVAAIVEGGQTMNPSTQELLTALENLPTDQIIILPNNKNIILAAQTAKELTAKHVEVIPCRSVPQGLAAMFRLAPDGNLEKVARDMENAIDEVESGEITIATRSVDIDGVSVKEGEVIALLNGKLVISTTTVEDAVLKLLERAHADHFEIITLYAGEGLPDREVDRIGDLVRNRYSEQVVEVQNGGQPHYPFIISVE